MAAGGQIAAMAAGERNRRALQTQQPAGPAVGGTAHGGVKNYSAEEGGSYWK
jgi:hypothetical protein